MDINDKTVWQIAAGNGELTHYAKLCLDTDVVILGPGRYGAWPDCELSMRRDNWTPVKVGIIRRFAEDIQSGDLVVLRVGTQHVFGVGEVVADYDWSERFSKVQGWDLQHYRRVRWLWHEEGRPKIFPVHTLKFGSSVQHLISPEVKNWLETLVVSPEAYSRPLRTF